MGKKRKKKRASPGRRGPAVVEWVGGRLVSPMYVTEGEPYRPEVIFWLELPSELVLAATIVDPEAPVSFGQVLLDTMASPLAGLPRRPSRIRVAEPALAAEVRQAYPGLEVVVAPTPELVELLGQLAEHMDRQQAGEAPSYFEGGRVSERAVEALFVAA